MGIKLLFNQLKIKLNLNQNKTLKPDLLFWGKKNRKEDLNITFLSKQNPLTQKTTIIVVEK